MNTEFEMGRAMRGKEHPMANTMIYRGWARSTVIGIVSGLSIAVAIALYLILK